jgi:hypothetical protein
MSFLHALLVFGALVSVAEAQCGNGVVNSNEDCDGGLCCTRACKFVTANTICRAAPAGATCAQADRCSGTSSLCYPSGPMASGTVCRAAVNVCDEADRCDGVSTACVDRKAPMGTTCPNLACESNSICDGQGTCIARSYDCPCAGAGSTARVPTPLPTPMSTSVNCAGCGNAGYGVGSSNWCRCCSNQPACLQLGRANIYNRASCISNNGFCSTTCLANGAPNPEHCTDVAGLPTPAPTTTRPPAPTPLTGSPECNLDRNTCTIESCISGSGCPIAGNASPGVTCDDHDDCTTDDRCALFGRCAGTNNCPSNCSGHGSCCRSQCTCDKTYSGADCGTRPNGGLLGDETPPAGTLRFAFTQPGTVVVMPSDASRGSATLAAGVATLTAQGVASARLNPRAGHLGIESGDRCASTGACVAVESDCWGTAVGQQSCRAGSVCCNDGNQLGSLINGPEQLVVQFQFTNGSAMRVQLVYAEISGLAPADRVSFIFATAPGDPIAQPMATSDAIFAGPPRAITGITVQSAVGRGFSLDAVSVRAVSGSETITQAPTMPPTTPEPPVTMTPPTATTAMGSDTSDPTSPADGSTTTATNNAMDGGSTTVESSTTNGGVIVPSDEGGLSGGEIAGIVIGVLLGLCLIGLVLFFLLRRRSGTKTVAHTTTTTTTTPATAPPTTTKEDDTTPAKDVDTAFMSPVSSPGTSPRDEPPPRKEAKDDDDDDAKETPKARPVGDEPSPATRRKRTAKRRESSIAAIDGGAATTGTEMVATTAATTTEGSESTKGSRVARRNKESSSGDVTTSSRQSSRQRKPKPSKRNLLVKETPPPDSKPEDQAAAGGLEALLSGQINVDDAFKTIERESSKKPPKK